jgi:hypothetical protein
MYQRTYEPLGQPTKQAKPSYRAPFSKGGEWVGEGDAEKLLTVLAGPSPFRTYIRPILVVRGSALPKKLLRIVNTPKGAPQHLSQRFTKDKDGKIVGGTIDRSKGTIYMLPAPGSRAHTRVQFALHELVHVFAHPFMDIVDDAEFERKYGRPCHKGEVDVGTFQRKYCSGFGEGATQVITETILAAQKIALYRDRPFREFTGPVRKLIEIFSLDALARAFFWGEVAEFTRAMQSRWGDAWQNVRNYTASRNPKQALQEIEKLELERWMKTRTPSPPGDYPIPRGETRYA